MSQVVDWTQYTKPAANECKRTVEGKSESRSKQIRAPYAAGVLPCGCLAAMSTNEVGQGCFSMQLQTQCSYKFKDGVEVGASLTGECLVETSARQVGILCNLGHAFGSGNIAQRFGDKRGLVIGLFQAHRHFLRSAKVLGDIITSGSRLTYIRAPTGYLRGGLAGPDLRRSNEFHHL